MPGPTLDEYNAALAELAAQGGGSYQPVAESEYMSLDPSVQFMSQPEYAPSPDVASGPPMAALSPADAAIQQFALQLQAQEEANAAPKPESAGGPDPLTDFAAHLAPGVEPETPMRKFQAVNPYVSAPEAPQQRPAAFRPRGGGGGVGGLMRSMERDAQATGSAAQQRANEAAAARDDALEQRRQAIEEAGRAQQESLQRQAALKRAENEAIVDELKQRESDMNVAQAKREMFMQDYEKAQAERDRMLPPHDRRTKQNVAMGAIAVALSGLGDAIAASGGVRQNGLQTTLGIIDTAIERDLQAQREAGAQAQGKADRALRRVDMFDKTTSTEQAASLAREAAIRSEYAGYLEAASKEYEGTIAGQNALEASQALRQQSEQMLFQAADAEAQHELNKAEALRMKRAQMAQQAAAGASPERLLKIEEQQLKNAKLRKELGGGQSTERDVVGYDRTKDVSSKAADDAQALASASAGVNADLAELKAIRERNAGKPTWSAADSKRAKIIVGGLADKASQLAGGGQAGEAARVEMLDTLGDPTDVHVFSDPSETYEGVREYFQNVTDARMEQLGYRSKAQAARGAFRPRR